MDPTDAAVPKFRRARPIWPAGQEREMNRFVGFRALLPSQALGSATLRITASTLYRAFLDDQFVGYGPARAAHGYARVDEWPLARAHGAGEYCLLAVEVAGYNVNSYYVLDQPSFLQAEVVSSAGEVLAASDVAGEQFQAFELNDHVQKVERYSVARTFSEVVRLRGDSFDWRRRSEYAARPLECAPQPPPRLLPRRVPYPDFSLATRFRSISGGTVRQADCMTELKRDWTLTCIGPDLKGFAEHELEVIPSLELQKLQTLVGAVPAGDEQVAVALSPGEYRILDAGTNLSGFIGLDVECEQPARLAVVFDEILSGADVSFNRLRCNNVVWIEMQPGSHQFETFEPYTFRYLKLICLGAPCRVRSVHLRRYSHPPIPADLFRSEDDRLNRVFAAGVETFRQNAVDLLTDCPSRERAGWLCDSFYTARTAWELTGSVQLERAFLENYLLPERFEHLPEGMVAMTYPADHLNGKFIPNWALWLVLQLEEYLSRGGDRAMVDRFESRVGRLFNYFQNFRNADGLLEKLQSWVFVEWSAANDFVQDVSYPTNMLYAAALDAGARLYGRAAWAADARHIRRLVLEQSFDGSFFVDNSVRRGGRLERTGNRSEVCQYYAFYFDVATPQSHGQLWRRLVEQFGPARPRTGAFADVHPANALMGYSLRLELLMRQGLHRQVCDEIIQYFLPMADLTGTLWEHNQPTASCCHGFASHVCVLLRQCAHVTPRAGRG